VAAADIELISKENDPPTSVRTDEVRAYLRSQADLSSLTKALTLYACRSGGRTFITVFTALSDAKHFAGKFAETHLNEASIAVLTAVGMNQPALYERTVKRTDVEVVLNPACSGGLTIRPTELRRPGFFGPAKPKIVERSMVWADRSASTEEGHDA
jgi:hypothetical protein